MILSNTAPYVRILVIGGSDAANNNSYEIFDAAALSPAANWSASAPFPNGQKRSLCSAVLLPDGNSPCTMIESPDAASIAKLVLVRPMVVTHQTDTEQKVLEMPYVHDHAHPTRLTLTAPHGGHPHSLAQQGYYMLFAVTASGVPSIAKWIYLH